jgi:septum formation protein
MHIILGSQSPRRNEIFRFFDLPFEQIKPQFDEEAVPFKGDPYHYVSTLAKGKADSFNSLSDDAIVLTADTIVYCEGKVYGKPKDDQEAIQFLKQLSGQWHQVITSLVIRSHNQEFQATEETRVLINTLTEEQIESYVKTLHLTDKAGGYLIQGVGGIIVKKIEGCYYNVVGLPVNALCELMQKVGINLWKHLKQG